MIKQVQAIKFQYSNQLILQEIIYWTLIGDISSGIQTRSRLTLFCEYFSFVSSIGPKKIDEVLKNVDWVMQCIKN
jgi:hypothetical protein